MKVPMGVILLILAVLITPAIVWAESGTIYLPIVANSTQPQRSERTSGEELAPQDSATPAPTRPPSVADLSTPPDASQLPLCPLDPMRTPVPPGGCRLPNSDNLPLCPANDSTPMPPYGCRVNLDGSEPFLVSMVAPRPTVRLSDNGEIIVSISPCVTPTPIADYRDLLEPGAYITGGRYYARGYETSNAPIPTLYPPPPGVENWVYVEPATAVIRYEAMSGTCP